MIFEGRNFDIIAGQTAPAIFYFGFVKTQLPSRAILIWNILCPALLLNIVINAAWSVPSVERTTLSFRLLLYILEMIFSSLI